MKLSKILNDLRCTCKVHAPEISVGVGISLWTLALWSGIKSTPKAIVLKEESKAEKPIDILKVTWKYYIPTVILASAGTASIIYGTKVAIQRSAAIASAYALSNVSFNEYKEKVKEVIGKKKEKEITEKIAEDSLEKHPIKERNITETGRGNTLCYDIINDRYFRSDIEYMRRAELEFNKLLHREGLATVNELIYVLYKGHSKLGDHLGWNSDTTEYLEFEFTSKLTPDGEPCLVLNYALPYVYMKG